MAKYRQERINGEMARELSVALREIKDARIIESFVSVMEVDCAKDLKTAKVYYSFLPGKCDAVEIKNLLDGASKFLRFRLAETLNLRETPALNFVFDDTVERGNRISSILRDVSKELRESEDRSVNAEKEDENRR